MRICRSIALVALMMSLASISSAQKETPAEATPRPMIDRCQSFCETFFNQGSDDFAECARGCDDGEVCSKRCTERFPTDDPKRMGCFKRCMANGRKFEPPPTPPLPQL